MPYELEYKKVHNTLSKKGLDNVYGYIQGQIINKLTIDAENHSYKIFLKDDVQQFVLQNEMLDDTTSFVVKAYTAEGEEVRIVDADPEIDGYVMSANFGENLLIEIGTTKPVYQDNKEFIPNYIIIEHESSNKWIMWPTNDNIVGYAENDVIVYTNSETNKKTISFKDFDWGDAYSFINNIIVDVTENSTNFYELTFSNIDSPILSDLKSMGFDIVLVPMRAPKRNKTEKAKQPLRSITNMRNAHQFSLYGEGETSVFTKVSLYLEPISLWSNSEEDSLIEIIDFQKTNYNTWHEYETPLPTSFFIKTQSRRTHITYGLRKAKRMWALFVCRGCGYDNGSNQGETHICFGLGIQKIKDESPHSGCSLQFLRIVEGTEVTLPRLALMATTNKNSVIEYEAQ